MLEILIVTLIVVAGVFFLGLCVFVHEFGHLLVALKCGLHVERFSIGFGKTLWGFTRNGVDYVVSALPFGGYVALPQLDPTDEPADSDGNPLPRARPRDRILTAFSGPFSNILFGFLLASVVWAVGVYRPAPVDSYEVHSVQEQSPEYEAGLRPGDEIVQLNGKDVPGTWSDFGHEIALTNGDVSLTFVRDGEKKTITYEPAPNPDVEDLGFPLFEVRLPVVVQKEVEAGTPAAAAGIQKDDRIRKVNGKPVTDSVHFSKMIRNTEGQSVSMTLERDGETITIPSIAAEERTEAGKTYYAIGVVPGQPQVKTRITPWAQFMNVITTTKRTLTSLVSPRSLVKAKHLSGPLGIVHMQYMMIRYGSWAQGLYFVVFVSFSLALLNLLPIPVLDGGHIVFAIIEGMSGKRIPARIAYGIQIVCAVLLIGFMLYVTYNDIRRGARTMIGEEDNEQQETTQDEVTQAPAESP